LGGQVIFDEVLYDYQKEAATRISEARRILLADQPGLGKTLEVLGALEVAGIFDRPSVTLIVTPIINAQTTWRDTVERFLKPRYPDLSLIDVSKGTASQKSKQFDKVYPDGPVVVLANHNALDMTTKGVRVPQLVTPMYDAVIIDESHMVLPIKDPRSLTNFWKGLGKVKMTDSCIRVAISGTPDRGKLDNRYGTWAFLYPERVGTKWSWLEENFWMAEQKVSRTRTIKVATSLKNQGMWLERDKAWMIRRTKQEVLPQLPPKRYVDVEIELGKEQRSAYLGQQMISERKILDARIEERDSGEAMVFALRARQLSTCSWHEEEGKVLPTVGGQSAKLDWLMEWFNERGFIEWDSMADSTAKVVIVSSFSKVLHWLKAELDERGIECAVLDGATSDVARSTIQTDFQTGRLRVVLLSGGMGVGINLDAADDLIMLDSPYDPDRIEQIEDRVHRASNMHHVTIWNLIAVDTIDQAIMEKVSKRYTTTRTIMDGSRGVEFGREVVARILKEESNG
jgi:SNF2 family DNA or RNA helicase